jgi:hypothetical protein
MWLSPLVAAAAAATDDGAAVREQSLAEFGQAMDRAAAGQTE